MVAGDVIGGVGGMSNAGSDRRKKTVISGQVKSAYVIEFASKTVTGGWTGMVRKPEGTLLPCASYFRAHSTLASQGQERSWDQAR